MRLSPDTFLDAFDGKWDGHQDEIHGLVRHGSNLYKIEVLNRADECLVTVFHDGAVAHSARTADPLDELSRFWREKAE